MRRLWVATLLVFQFVCFQPHALTETVFPENIFRPFEWRNIGPNRGGRSIAVSGSSSRPLEYYFGATGGGLWKTANGGTDWFPVSDGHIQAASVGAVAVCETDPDIVYIGTGEAQFRGTMSPGDGVYRSSDGGTSWSYLGLESSSGQQSVARIRVDPNDCNRVYVAVLGDPWGPNEERGVFRSSSGGGSWEKVLYRSERAGAADLTLDPTNSRILYAALWEVQRRPWEANSGGQGSGLFKSADGGDTWTELTASPGLPKDRLGKMGVSVSGADPDRVYAVVEAEEGGVVRSDDGGETWTHVNRHRALYARSEYYNRIYADPKDRQTVYVLNRTFFRSRDGGETYTPIRTPHGDNQDLWIAPNDPTRMIEANDGGANVTVDGGKTWTEQDYPTAQLYHVTTTHDFPYHVCGAQQDNTSVCVPSDGDGSYFYTVAGGEQGYIAVHPEEPDVFYAGAQRGFLTRYDRRTGQAQNVEVWPDNPQGLPPSVLKERFQWTFPILLSPQDPEILYAASQYLWKSTSRGSSWERISPDLTYADPETLAGEQSVIRNQNSQDYYATVFAVGLSKHDASTIWTGSDDGRIHLTRDGGRNWEDVTPPELPAHSKVSLIEVSSHTPEKAYIAAIRYMMQDLAPYVLKTEDYGKNWTKIVSGIPSRHYVRAVREDPVRPGLLFAGTEHGPYVSFNDGAHWQSLARNLPDLQVSDVTIKDNDLVISTYGRSFYILDDISPLRELTPDVTAQKMHLFAPSETVRTIARPVFGDRRNIYRRTRIPGANRVHAYYYLHEPAQKVTLEFLNPKGELIRSFTGTPDAKPESPPRDEVGSVNRYGWSSPPPLIETGAGLHSFAWDMRYPPATEFSGLNLRGGTTEGPIVTPGEYQVRITVDGQTETRSFWVRKDPRLTDVTQEDLEEQFELGMKIHRRLDDALSAIRHIRKLKEQVDNRIEASKDPKIEKEGASLNATLTEIEGSIYEGRARDRSDILHYGIKLTNKIANLLGHVLWTADAAPTGQTRAVFEELSQKLEVHLSKLDRVLEEDLARFNRLLSGQGLAPVN